VLAGVYLLCHGALLLFDLHHPGAFLTGDRAAARVIAMTNLIAARPSLAGAAALNGPIGDYLGQLLPYALGGRIGVLLAQLALGLMATLSCQALGSRILKSETRGLAAGLIYLMLPGSLLDTHTLTSEAIANPLLVTGVALLGAYLDGARRTGALYVAALLLGAAALVRPQYLLLPVAILPALLAGSAPKTRIASAALAAAIFLGPVLVGAGVERLAQSLDHASDAGRAPVTRNDMPYHLWSRATRMSAIARFTLQPAENARQAISPTAFFSLAAAHPGAFSATLVSDATNLIANPGTNQLLVAYLGLFQTGRDLAYWQRVRDRDGLIAMSRALLALDPGFVWVLLGSTILWIGFLILALRGAIASPKGAMRTLLLGFVFYCLIVPFAAGVVRWTHRTPIDFALAIFAVAGLAAGPQLEIVTRASTRNAPDFVKGPSSKA
jgi:hypothetical protein